MGVRGCSAGRAAAPTTSRYLHPSGGSRHAPQTSMLPLVAALLAAAASSGATAAATATPMRGWMTWERYTCGTDCGRFPATGLCPVRAVMINCDERLIVPPYDCAGWCREARDENGNPPPSWVVLVARLLSGYIDLRFASYSATCVTAFLGRAVYAYRLRLRLRLPRGVLRR